MNFRRQIARLCTWRKTARSRIEGVTVEVTEGYARRVLRLRKDDPLVYRGLELRCIGSPRWRAGGYLPPQRRAAR